MITVEVELVPAFFRAKTTKKGGHSRKINESVAGAQIGCLFAQVVQGQIAGKQGRERNS